MRDDRGSISQAELQRSINRVASQFMCRVNQATLEGWGAPPRMRTAMTRQQLLYTASALEIASAPLPEANLLDMLVFMTLSRRILEEHWIPQVRGPGARAVSRAFCRSERDVWDLADGVVNRTGRRVLKELMRQWLGENPGNTRVEGVRLLDFCALAGGEGTRARALLADVMADTGAADEARLLVTRAVFLVHRLPFLLRAQARIGPGRHLAEAASLLARADRLLAGSAGLHPVIGRIVDHARKVALLTGRACDQAKEVNPLVPETLRSLRLVEELVRRMTTLLEQVEWLATASADARSTRAGTR